MNFFEQQDKARNRTRLLVVLLLLGTAAVVLAVNMVIYATFVVLGESPPSHLLISLISLGILGAGSGYKLMQLSSGGEAVAQSLGGRAVCPSTTEPSERQLINVVEEMSIASGCPAPRVYLLEDSSINAFAAGFTQGDAVIGVTRGAMEKLSRDELQGVIAHEFSHIIHGDMRLNLRLMGLVHGLLVIGLIGRELVYAVGRGSRYRSRSRGGRNEGGAIVVMLGAGLALLVIGYLGTFFGRAVKAAISRRREFLADASAVQYTRNPRGIGGALRKLATAGSGLGAANAEEASHLMFGSLRRRSFVSGLLDTHPPLPERIRRIDPALAVGLGEAEAGGGERAGAAGLASGLAGAPGGAGERAPEAAAGVERAPGGAAGGAGSAAGMLDRIGDPRAEHVAYGARVLRELPRPLLEAAHDPLGAQALVLAFLLDADREVRARQLEALSDTQGWLLEETQLLERRVRSVGREARLPLVELAMPALRELSLEQRRAFADAAHRLCEATPSTSIFEYLIQRLAVRHLAEASAPRKRRRASGAELTRACALALSMLAHVGHRTEEAARFAYDAALDRLRLRHARPDMQPWEACRPSALDEALDALSGARLEVRERLLDACAHCVAVDGQVTVEEAELLRAIAEGLGCPMPPLVPDTTSPA